VLHRLWRPLLLPLTRAYAYPYSTTQAHTTACLARQLAGIECHLYAVQVVEAIAAAVDKGMRIPIIYNTNAYALTTTA
jgi:hypothetical protein